VLNLSGVQFSRHFVLKSPALMVDENKTRSKSHLKCPYNQKIMDLRAFVDKSITLSMDPLFVPFSLNFFAFKKCKSVFLCFYPLFALWESSNFHGTYAVKKLSCTKSMCFDCPIANWIDTQYIRSIQPKSTQNQTKTKENLPKNQKHFHHFLHCLLKI
jgi:hypothetical protein